MAKEDYIIPEKKVIPVKEWQSLSDDEIDEIWVKSFGSSEIVHNLDFARAIEQALKEKNQI